MSFKTKNPALRGTGFLIDFIHFIARIHYTPYPGDNQVFFIRPGSWDWANPVAQAHESGTYHRQDVVTMIRTILSYFQTPKTNPNRLATFQDISNAVDILSAEQKPVTINIHINPVIYFYAGAATNPSAAATVGGWEK